MLRVARLPWLVLSALMCLAGVEAKADDAVAESKSTLKRWIELQKTHQATRSDWKVEAATLRQTIELLESEESTLDARIEKIENSSVETDTRREKLSNRQTELRKAEASVNERFAKLQARLLELEPIMPLPLKRTVQPLLRTLRRPAKDAHVEKHIQAMLSVLAEVDKFNSAFTVTGELIEIDGKKVQVDVIYLGLAQAYYVNRARDKAGIGSPTPTGWKWTARNEFASSINKVIAIYRDEQPAEFIPLPAILNP